MLKNPNKRITENRGFTIVELLIVVVVIAILATITVVSYNGIQKRAHEVALQSDIRGAATVLELDNTNNGSYPASASAADGGKGLKASDSTNFEYSYTATNNSYCLSASSSRAGIKSFYVSSQGGQITEGLCVGHSPAVPTSAGETWSLQSIAANSWADVTFGNGIFMAVSGRSYDQTSVVSTSTNGKTWANPTEIGTLPAWEPKIVYTGSKFVVAFGTGRGVSAVSSNNGQSWQHGVAAANVSSYISKNLTHGAGLIVSVKATPPDHAYTHTRLSTDGLSWTQTQTSVLHSSWNSVVYGNGVFVAVGSGGGSRVMTSLDGTNWTARSSPLANSFTSVTYGKGLFVAVSMSGTKRVMTSPDGITWTEREATFDGAWQAVAFGGGKFVAVANSGTDRIMTSTDGITWSAKPAPQNNPWGAITYGNGCFVATAGSGTNRVMTSCQ